VLMSFVAGAGNGALVGGRPGLNSSCFLVIKHFPLEPEFQPFTISCDVASAHLQRRPPSMVPAVGELFPDWCVLI
jgi:hypothetical protein